MTDIEYDIIESFYDIVDNEYAQFIEDCRSGKMILNRSWLVIPATMLKTVWLGRVRYGFFRNIKPLHKMRSIIFRNVAKLRATTELAGHTQVDPLMYITNDLDEQLTEQQYDDFMYSDWFTFNNELAITDYGMKPLEELAWKMMKTGDPDQLWILIDQALNVVHCNGDLAAFFVQGGSESLCEVSMENYKSKPLIYRPL